MARPTKPKDLKPKADESGGGGGETSEAPAQSGGGSGGGGGPLDIKFLIMVAASCITSVLAVVGSTYVLAPMVIVPAVTAELAHLKPGEGGEEHGDEHGGEHGPSHDEPHVGLNLELDEFTVNLKEDPSLKGKQFLRTKISLSVGVPPEEDCHHITAENPEGEKVLALAYAEGTLAGASAPIMNQKNADRLLASGGGDSPQVACMKHFKSHMAMYVPTMRDIINTALMKRTAGTISRIQGQEMLKDEIKEKINYAIDPKYKILRVNIEDFIIQY